jgi:hypothetical protein
VKVSLLGLTGSGLQVASLTTEKLQYGKIAKATKTETLTEANKENEGRVPTNLNTKIAV